MYRGPKGFVLWSLKSKKKLQSRPLFGTEKYLNAALMDSRDHVPPCRPKQRYTNYQPSFQIITLTFSAFADNGYEYIVEGRAPLCMWQCELFETSPAILRWRCRKQWKVSGRMTRRSCASSSRAVNVTWSRSRSRLSSSSKVDLLTGSGFVICHDDCCRTDLTVL